MHPEMMRELMNQRMAEVRSRAHEARLARAARKLVRARRDLAEVSRTLAVAEVPGYADTVFTGTGRRFTGAGRPTHGPAQRRAHVPAPRKAPDRRAA